MTTHYKIALIYDDDADYATFRMADRHAAVEIAKTSRDGSDDSLAAVIVSEITKDGPCNLAKKIWSWHRPDTETQKYQVWANGVFIAEYDEWAQAHAAEQDLKQRHAAALKTEIKER